MSRPGTRLLVPTEYRLGRLFFCFYGLSFSWARVFFCRLGHGQSLLICSYQPHRTRCEPRAYTKWYTLIEIQLNLPYRCQMSNSGLLSSNLAQTHASNVAECCTIAFYRHLVLHVDEDIPSVCICILSFYWEKDKIKEISITIFFIA
jgi:hypothetical protein